MARFGALLGATVLVLLAPLIYAAAASKDNLVGNVFFLEDGKQEYLRRGSLEGNVEEDVFSREETAAAIAVLLGVPPPVMLSSASSARIDFLLSSNPFKRPHAVVALTIKGISLESLTTQEIEKVFGSSSFQQRPFSVNGHLRPFELPGQDVVLESVNKIDYEHAMFKLNIKLLKESLGALVSFLEGSYIEAEDDVVILRVPLPFDNGFEFSLDFHTRPDRNFALELLALVDCTQSVSRLQTQSQGGQNQAKLFTGTFSTLELMEEGSDHRQEATKLFLYTAARVLSALEATYNGQLVGVLVSTPPGTSVSPMFNIRESRSSRFLLDDELAPSPSSAFSNQTLYDAEVKKLLSRSLVLVTILVLLIASGLGSCFLLFMPLTRDTLLYAAVKLD